jgi:predicted nucleotidyltransferase
MAKGECAFDKEKWHFVKGLEVIWNLPIKRYHFYWLHIHKSIIFFSEKIELAKG